MQVWAYCRESSKATSTKSQLISIREWAEREGHEVTEEFIDFEAARDSKSRPALLKMLEKLASVDVRPDAIVATEMSRIGVKSAYYKIRDLVVERAGVQILFAESTLEISDDQSEEDEIQEVTDQFTSTIEYLMIKRRIGRGFKQRYKRQLPGAVEPLQPWELPVGKTPTEKKWYKEGIQAEKFKLLRSMVRAEAPLAVIARAVGVKDYRTVRAIIIRQQEMFDRHKIDTSYAIQKKE